MIRYNNLAKWLVSAQDDVTSLLAFYVEACFSQSLNTIPSGYLG